MTYKPQVLITCFFSMLTICSFAQVDGDIYRQSTAAKVKGYNGIEKISAWCGGFNNPQLAMADLNKDGIKDLVVYEDGLSVKTFLGKGGRVYVYESYYEQFFPRVYTYLKLLDYNADNIPDLIQRGLYGYELSWGYYDNDTLKFTLYKSLDYYYGASGWVKAYSETESIPGVADVDGDSDLDFMHYHPAFQSLLTFYRNCRIEDQLPKDSVEICIKDWCWGKTTHSGGKTYFLGVGCENLGAGTCKSTKTTDGANTVCLLDYDGDGDMDYLTGHGSYSDMQLLMNGKADYSYPIDTIIAQDTVWDVNGKVVKVDLYPAAFSLDIDQDNDYDILVTPLAKNTENYKCIHYIENIGTSSVPQYAYRHDTLFVEDIIDVGKSSYPVLYDYNKDGKKDLFIGSEGYYQGNSVFKSRVSYYLNTSSSSGVSFELQTEDFLNLSAQNFKGASLAIGDIDNDTLDDLIIGHNDGTFTYYKNYAAYDTIQPVWQLEALQLMNASKSAVLDVGDYSTPCIYDINNDGKNDLISGNLEGDLYYYENISLGIGAIGLMYRQTNIGGVRIPKDPVYKVAFSAPYIGTVDDSKNDYLVIGSYGGRLYKYDLDTNLSSFSMTDSFYSYVDVGNRSAPSFANLDNDSTNLHEMILGNELGGVLYYKQDFPVGIANKELTGSNVVVYPNPAKDIVYIKWGSVSQEHILVKVINATGVEVSAVEFDSKNKSGQIYLPNLSSGLYYCIIQTGKERFVRAISVIK